MHNLPLQEPDFFTLQIISDCYAAVRLFGDYNESSMDGWMEDEREDVDEFGILLGDGIGRAMRISITQRIERQRNSPILTVHESTSSKKGDQAPSL